MKHLPIYDILVIVLINLWLATASTKSSTNVIRIAFFFFLCRETIKTFLWRISLYFHMNNVVPMSSPQPWFILTTTHVTYTFFIILPSLQYFILSITHCIPTLIFSVGFRCAELFTRSPNLEQLEFWRLFRRFQFQPIPIPNNG